MSDFTENTEGVFLGLANEDYRAAPGVNVSALKDAITPAHYRASRDEAKPEEPSAAQQFGTLFHALALEGKGDFVAKPKGMNFTTKEGKAWRDAQTLPIVSESEAEALASMAGNLQSHQVIASVFRTGGNSEVSGFKGHESSGLLLKGRADYITQDNAQRTVIVDLKTCGFGCGSETAFAKEVAKWKYHQQAAFYLDLFGASFFMFVAVEKEPPFAVNVFQLDAESIDQGRSENEKALAMIAEAEASGNWSSYPQQLHTITLPRWAKSL